MVPHYIYAAIKNGVVENTFIIPYSEFDPYGEAVRITTAVYGFDAFPIAIEQYPVQEGDLYENDRFYRVVDGEKHEIQYIPTEAENVARLTSENETLRSQLTNAQLALVELYEMLE